MLQMGGKGRAAFENFKILLLTDNSTIKAALPAPGWSVYSRFINDCDHLILKTYMTRIEGENTRLRHNLARLNRKTLCYSKSEKMLRASIKLLLHYLHYRAIPA